MTAACVEAMAAGRLCKEVVGITKRFISALLAVVLVLSVCVGCKDAEQNDQDGASLDEGMDFVPTLFTDITGIPQDKIVMTVGETEVPAELYFYWLCYVCSSPGIQYSKGLQQLWHVWLLCR